MGPSLPVRETVQRIFNRSLYLDGFVPCTALFARFAGGGGKQALTLSKPYWQRPPTTDDESSAEGTPERSPIPSTFKRVWLI